jgi:hypothetical protein
MVYAVALRRSTGATERGAAALKATNEALPSMGGGWWPTRGSF